MLTLMLWILFIVFVALPLLAIIVQILTPSSDTSYKWDRKYVYAKTTYSKEDIEDFDSFNTFSFRARKSSKSTKLNPSDAIVRWGKC